MPHGIVSFDDEAIEGYVGKLVAKTVEETLNTLLDKEADQLVNAERYERTDECQAISLLDHWDERSVCEDLGNRLLVLLTHGVTRHLRKILDGTRC